MTSVRRALAISFAERYVLIGVSLLSNVLLARLLTPAQIGIYSVSLAVIGIAQVLRDFGIGNFLIQVKQLTDAHIRTAFGFSLVVGGTLFAVVFLAAPWAGEFYKEEQIVRTMRISSLNFLVLPFCTVSLSLLRREMAFQKLAVVNLLSSVVTFAATLLLAYRGFGPDSMAVGAVLGNVVTGAAAWIARADRSLLLPSFSEWRTLMHFGSRSSAANIVSTISMDVNELVIGKILGFAPVAMISRAQGLMNLFHRDIMSAIRNVAFPAYSATYRKGEDLEAQHNFSVAAITVIGWPFYAFATVFSGELLRLLFGPQWDAARPMVPWFCLAGAVAATCNLIVPMLTASGRIDLASRIDLVLQPMRAGLLVGGVLLFQTMTSFAVLFFVTSALSCPYIYYVKSKSQKTDFRRLFTGLRQSAMVTAMCMLPCGVVAWLAPRHDGILNLGYVALAGTLCAGAWLLSLVACKHPLAEDAVFTGFIQKFGLRKRSAPLP